MTSALNRQREAAQVDARMCACVAHEQEVCKSARGSNAPGCDAVSSKPGVVFCW